MTLYYCCCQTKIPLIQNEFAEDENGVDYENDKIPLKQAV